MPGKKETSIIDEVVDGFADIVDGSIFDFDDELKEGNEDGRGNGTDVGANAGMGESNEGSAGKQRPGKRPTVPGRIEGVTITDSPTGKKKGSAPGSEKPPEGNDDGNGTGEKPTEPADKSK